MLRCFNRMNDLIDGARVEGTLLYHGVDLYDPTCRPREVRRRIGMVFQKPNPFPKSIYDNVAFGPQVNGGKKGELDDIVEQSLRRAALWDEVKDRLKTSALGLSGGQQQRLCIARAIAVEPEVILMDEPCSALDPIATARIEDLMQELKQRYTIVIVTHNMQQAARVSDRTAFFTTEVNADERQPHRRARRVRPHREDLLEPVRRADRELRHRPVRLSEGRPACGLRFHAELEQLRCKSSSLAGPRRSRILERMRDLLDGRPRGRRRPHLAADDEIDAPCTRHRGALLPIWRLQAPMAGDLRRIVAAVRCVAELERSADLVVNICKARPPALRSELDPKLRGLIAQMGEEAQQLYAGRHRRLRRGRRGQRPPSTTWTTASTSCSGSSSQAIFESHAAGRSTSRPPCSWPWSAATTSASATTP